MPKKAGLRDNIMVGPLVAGCQQQTNGKSDERDDLHPEVSRELGKVVEEGGEPHRTVGEKRRKKERANH